MKADFTTPSPSARWWKNIRTITVEYEMWNLLGFVVLELNMQTVFNANLHLDRGVQLGIRAQCVHDDVHFLGDVGQSAAYRRTKEVSTAQPRQMCM